jgi:hypothetical protein
MRQSVVHDLGVWILEYPVAELPRDEAHVRMLPRVSYSAFHPTLMRARTVFTLSITN